MMRLILAFLLFSGSAIAQRTQLVDALNGEPIPFAKVIPTPGQPLLADIDGYFSLPEGTEQVLFQAHDYYDSVFTISQIGEKVELRAQASDLEEVTILPGVNPAERIMELAIANRKKNHPMSDMAFSYTSYSKFIFTIDPEALTQISDTTTDSNLIELREYFNRTHLFMMESTTEKYFEPPYREKEVITAYKVSGFTDPALSTFANDLQTFNFYENQFSLFGRSYVNPLAFGGVRRYLFILEDQTVVNGDTTFTIRFQPRKDKNFEGMKGWLYISSNGYALEKVIAEPATVSETMSAKIVQEYAFIDGKKWFPVKLSTEVVFPGFQLDEKLKDGHLMGKGSTYIANIHAGADLSDKKFNAVLVETVPDANEKDSAHWDAQRTYDLTDKEIRTYELVDSISKVYRLDQRLSSIASLAEGKIPVGYVQFDLARLLDYRTYEGYRIGFGMENSKKLMKQVTIGGYFGYGTRDKDWKYGGYGKWMVFPKHFVELQASFQEDLVERGGYQFLAASRGGNLNALYRHLYVLNMDRQRKAEVALSGYLTPRIKLLGSVSYQRIRLTEGYEFDNGEGLHLDGGRAFEQAEMSMEVIWTIREKVMYLGAKRVSMGSKYPQITAKATKGISGIERSTLDYMRFNVDIQQDIPIRAVGKFSYLISAGKTVGNVPLYLNQVAIGTGGKDWNLSVMNSFETMKSSTFYQSEQLSLFTRFTFKPFKTNKKWTKPQISLHHAMGTGRIERRESHNIAFRTMEKGYYEAGLILDKLLVINTSGFGLGIFYNYGYYSMPKVADNLTFKLSFSFVLN